MVTNAKSSWTALGDPTRHTIFELLVEHPCSVGELARVLPVTRPAVSQHLKVLKDAGLVVDSLVYRYDPAASPDGLAGDEGTFSLCTFNYVDALARAGRLEEARLIFEKMLTYANHVGLYSEEIGSTGEQLGNFPQAFTHLALIDAAITLNAALDQAKAAGRGAATDVPAARRQADAAAT